MSTTKKPPAGWYDDPSRPKTKRYWDGDAWTEQRQEEPPPEPVAGWKVAASILVGIVLPLLGLIIGVAMWSRARTPAVVVLLVSLVAGLFWWARLASGG